MCLSLTISCANFNQHKDRTTVSVLATRRILWNLSWAVFFFLYCCAHVTSACRQLHSFDKLEQLLDVHILNMETFCSLSASDLCSGTASA